jgi:outer membrane protein assembly factor BamB
LKKQLIRLAICVAVVVSGCRSTPPRPETIGPVGPGSFVRAWKADLGTGGESFKQIFLRDNWLFLYTQRNTSYVVTRTGGEARFIQDIKTTGGILRPPIVLADKFVYPTATTLEIYNLHGRHLRTLGLPNSTHGPATGMGNTIYASLDYPGAGRVGAVDLTRQFNVMKWELFTHASVRGAPAAHGDGVYIGSEDGTVYALGEDRTPMWAGLPGSVFKTYGRIVADMKADDFGVYVAAEDAKLYCLDRASGQVKWQYFGTDALVDAPAVTAASVYQYVPGAGVAAIDKTTGSYNRKPRWIAREGRQFLAEDEKNAYLRRRDNTIVAVDRLTGEPRFESSTPFDMYTTNEKDSMIYAATKAGRVVAIRPVVIPGQVGVLVMNDVSPEAVARND